MDLPYANTRAMCTDPQVQLPTRPPPRATEAASSHRVAPTRGLQLDLFALCDDGGCTFPDEGLMRRNCLSGMPTEMECDGDEFGCTHVDACNFTAGATEDDGSCFFQPWPGQTLMVWVCRGGLAQPFCGFLHPAGSPLPATAMTPVPTSTPVRPLHHWVAMSTAMDRSA